MSTIKNGRLDQYGTEPLKQQQIWTAGVKGLKQMLHAKISIWTSISDKLTVTGDGVGLRMELMVGMEEADPVQLRNADLQPSPTAV